MSEENLFRQQRFQQELQQLEASVKQVMTKDALQRYGNIKIAHPQKALHVLGIIGQALKQGKVNQVDDEQLKELLRSINQKTDFKITRK